MDKCIACSACSEKCPKKVPNAYDKGLSKRKAVYVQYAQAVPLKYAIDADNCIYLMRGKCKACEKFCPTGAIDFEDEKKELKLNVGAVILASGSEAFNPRRRIAQEPALSAGLDGIVLQETWINRGAAFGHGHRGDRRGPRGLQVDRPSGCWVDGYHVRGCPHHGPGPRPRGSPAVTV